LAILTGEHEALLARIEAELKDWDKMRGNAAKYFARHLRELVKEGPNERAAFVRWLTESPCPEAQYYRRARKNFDAARRGLAHRWSEAHKTFRDLGRPGTGPSDGAIAKAEAR